MTQSQKKPDPRKVQNEELDEALEESFPASDPPSMTQPRSSGDKMKEKSPAKPALADEDEVYTRVDLYENEDK